MTWWNPKKCAICGKKALYVRPPEGRCREHRDVQTRASKTMTAHYEANSNLKSAQEYAIEYGALRRDRGKLKKKVAP